VGLLDTKKKSITTNMKREDYKKEEDLYERAI